MPPYNYTTISDPSAQAVSVSLNDLSQEFEIDLIHRIDTPDFLEWPTTDVVATRIRVHKSAFGQYGEVTLRTEDVGWLMRMAEESRKSGK